MGMDPGSPKCDSFYKALVRWNLPLLTHAGEEKAVYGGSLSAFNNPLRLRRPWTRVRVIVPHCASLGEHIDIDRGPDGPSLASFDLFQRLMDEARYDGRLFGDISAVTQANRAESILTTLIRRVEWHPRLINGSDYPLPGVMPLFSLRRFVRQQFITDAQAQVLSEIRPYNPLLFDLFSNGVWLAAGTASCRWCLNRAGFSKWIILSRKTCEPYCLRMEGIL